MSDLVKDLEELHDRILAAEPGARYLLQPELGALIESLETAGEAVPEGIRALNDELVTEAIEARFENMPV
jgi:hypothetical protein